MTTRLDDLRRALRRVTRDSERAAAARAALPPGSSRARVTTANARWARHAEERDRLAREIADIEADAERGE